MRLVTVPTEPDAISVLRSGAEALGKTEGIAGAAANVIELYAGRWSDKIQRRNEHGQRS